MESPGQRVSKRIGGAPSPSPRRVKSTWENMGYLSSPPKRLVQTARPSVMRKDCKEDAPVQTATHVDYTALMQSKSIQETVGGSPARRKGDGANTLYAIATEQHANKKAVSTCNGAREWALLQEFESADQEVRVQKERQQRKQQHLENFSQLRAQDEACKREQELQKQMAKQTRQELEADAAKYFEEETQKRDRMVQKLQRFNDDRRKQEERARAQKKNSAGYRAQK